jgi:hypothetical protein
MRYTVTIEIELEAEVTHFIPGRPGYISGPPEDCYPAEAAEIEYRLFHNGKPFEATDCEIEAIDNQLIEQIEDEYERERAEAAIERWEARR